MGELTLDDVLRILELIDKSQFDYFHLTLGDLELTVSKHGLPVTRGEEERGAAPPPPAGPAVGVAATVEPPSGRASGPTAPETQAEPGATRGAGAAPLGQASTAPAAELVTVTAPMIGTFYRAPSPEAPPFVEVGSHVAPDTTVGLIEAMKVFTSVTAGTAGEVVEILVDSGQFVEYGQPLLRIRPAAAGSG
ncbi:MAG TPA: acetyl-CoA carboxylase [Chloroflexota bacterium]|nr:acetyl-CoA carboxylase [Chloroflexota bacterium]